MPETLKGLIGLYLVTDVVWGGVPFTVPVPVPKNCSLGN